MNNKGIANDSIFYSMYPEIYEFFSSQDGSVQQVFVNIPGVHSPMGMVVLEWVNEEVKTNEEWRDIENKALSEVPRINALISKYTP